MKMKYIIVIIWGCLISCSKEHRQFHIPKIIGNTNIDTVNFKCHNEKFSDDFPIYAGLYSFEIDSIVINPIPKRKSLRKPIQIESLDTNWSYDFDIEVDYSQNIFLETKQIYQTFPVFISNPSADTLNLSALVFGDSRFSQKIQHQKEWISLLSYEAYSWRCSANIGSLKIPPLSYIVLLYPKFSTGRLSKMKISFDFHQKKTMESKVFYGLINQQDYNLYYRADSLICLKAKWLAP